VVVVVVVVLVVLLLSTRPIISSSEGFKKSYAKKLEWLLVLLLDTAIM